MNQEAKALERSSIWMLRVPVFMKVFGWGSSDPCAIVFKGEVMNFCRYL